MGVILPPKSTNQPIRNLKMTSSVLAMSAKWNTRSFLEVDFRTFGFSRGPWRIFRTRLQDHLALLKTTAGFTTSFNLWSTPIPHNLSPLIGQRFDRLPKISRTKYFKIFEIINLFGGGGGDIWKHHGPNRNSWKKTDSSLILPSNLGYPFPKFNSEFSPAKMVGLELVEDDASFPIGLER